MTNLQNVYKMLSLSGLGGLRASSLEASGLHDTNLNTLSTQTPRGQDLLGHIQKERQIQMMAVIFFILDKPMWQD